MEKIKRTSIGTTELDRILNGGLPIGSLTLVTGGPGTGKTILSAQFIYNGAVKFSEMGIVVTFNESSKTFKQNMNELGWDFDKLENEGKVKILDFVSMQKAHLNMIIDTILEEVRVFGAKRLVIDSITALIIAFGEKSEARTTVSIIQKLLRKLDCTTILISETPWGQKGLSSGIEEFIVDGIIRMEMLPVKGELRRRIIVLKMRGIPHEMKFYQYSINAQDGIVITPYPEVT
jgi:circadian clock protein KaiC